MSQKRVERDGVPRDGHACVPPPPHAVGPFRILQVLGEGGMGVVYEAEQTAPVRRRVALKVVKPGLDSKEVVARFEIERQALAVMDHPGIAKVLDAGVTPAGQPYFAMELVKGLPLTDYCDARRLSTRQRIELFIAVCHAVQHAHQKGVIHRDLKPSNVLVAEHDGAPEPKIIDFGVAKALGQQLTERTLVTELGRAIGTMAYMSPEQAEATGLDVDTRADVYSLGVMLYELLVGRLPVDPAVLGAQAFMLRLLVGDTNAPPPSARLSTLGAEGRTVARTRRTDPEHLRRELRGDLDWIVMKAMDPDRACRYETVNALALDLQRFLANEPVRARPPTVRYRTRKFVRRHRAAVAAGALVFAATVAGAVAATAGMVRATRAERHAAQEAEAARQVTAFLVELFRVSGPGTERGDTVSARTLLQRGAQRVQHELAGQPLLQSRILHTMGSVYNGLGLYDDARALLLEALRVRERELGPADSSVAATLETLGSTARGKGAFAEADGYLERALRIREALAAHDPGGVRGPVAGLALLRMQQGRDAEAESLFRRVLALDEAAGIADERLARDLMGLGAVHWGQGRFAEAEPLYRRALAIQERTLGTDHVEVAATLNNLGALYWTQNRFDDALPLYERTRAIFARTLDADHPDMASILNNLGETYWKLRRPAQAEAHFRRALTIKERALAPDHPSIAVTLNGLAGLLRDEGRHAEAAPLYQRALAIRRRAFAPGHPAVTETEADYAELQRRTAAAR